jgi:SHS2 domain-containing protein
MFELFEHTADLGLRVRAPDLPALFREAGEGLFAMIADARVPLEPTREFRFQLRATRHDDLLFDWLNELLYTFDTTGCVLGGFEVEVRGFELRARAGGAPLAAGEREGAREVKAITYHGLKVEPAADGWLAEVIVDI